MRSVFSVYEKEYLRTQTVPCHVFIVCVGAPPQCVVYGEQYNTVLYANATVGLHAALLAHAQHGRVQSMERGRRGGGGVG